MAELAAEIVASRDVFEALLTGREYLFGEFGAADCVAFPFLRFARYQEENDPYVFHQICASTSRSATATRAWPPGSSGWRRGPAPSVSC